MLHFLYLKLDLYMYYFDLRHNVKELKIQHKNLRRDKFRHGRVKLEVRHKPPN